MGRAISGLFMVGVVVMLFTGRVSWLSGGGVLMPHVLATFEPAGPGKPRTMTLTNTGTETLVNLQASTNRWQLSTRRGFCRELRPGETVQVSLESVEGGEIYVFAGRYLLPAGFRIGR